LRNIGLTRHFFGQNPAESQVALGMSFRSLVAKYVGLVDAQAGQRVHLKREVLIVSANARIADQATTKRGLGHGTACLRIKKASAEITLKIERQFPNFLNRSFRKRSRLRRVVIGFLPTQ
jgi:hypothetical protein